MASYRVPREKQKYGHLWSIRRSGQGKEQFYVASTDRVDGKIVNRKLHRMVMNAPYGVQVDHINGDTLDNRRCNLRLCSHAENQHNKNSQAGTSKYKGVYLYKRDKKWRAMIAKNKKNIHLGYFNDEIQAAHAYDEAARQLFGEFARLNFPNPGEQSCLA